MVDTQVRPSDVTKFPIIEAMLTVPRELFVPNALQEAAYAGENLEIAPGRTILDPRTLAKILEVVNIQPTDLVLDVACGMGYSCAVAAHLADLICRSGSWLQRLTVASEACRAETDGDLEIETEAT